jgi:protein-glutamine gamma-glutamyltransferase
MTRAAIWLPNPWSRWRASGPAPASSPALAALTMDRDFLKLSLATATLGVLCYAASENRMGIALLAGLASLVSWAMVSARPARRLPRLALNLLVLAAGLNTALAVFTGAGLFNRGESELVSSLTDFLSLIVLIKMMDRGRPRDEAQLLSLSVFVVIGAVLTSNSLLLGVTLVAYVPTALATAMLWQLHAGAYGQRERLLALRPDRGSGQAAPASSPIRITIAGFILVCLLSSLTLFVLMPRTLSHQALGGWGLAGSGARVDFSPQITLGQSGTLSISEEQVGEVAVRDQDGNLTEAKGGPLYLRGAVLEEYLPTTGQWRKRSRPGDGVAQSVFRPFAANALSSTLPAGESVRLMGAWTRRSGLSESLTPDGPLPPGAVIQDITLRQAGPGDVPLLTLWRPFELRMETQSRIELDVDAGLLTQRDAPRAGRLAYRVVSAPDASDAAADGPRRTRLEIAGQFAEGRIRAEVEQVLTTERLPTDLSLAPADTIRAAARAVERHLRTTRDYSLEMIAPRPGQDPIESFLFETRRGHCEYFAAAMTAMLRSVGVESRIITGYVVAEFNGISQHYVIRRADAHAWVEVKSGAGGGATGAPTGWETFDPTPPSSLPASIRAESANWLSDLRQVWEAVELAWIERVVSFEQTGISSKIDLVAAGMAARQRALMVRRAIDRSVATMRSWIPGLGRGSAIAVLAVTLAASAIAAWTLGRWAYRWTVEHGWAGVLRLLGLGPADGAKVRFYTQLLALLRQAGVPKPENRPPIRHAGELVAAGLSPLAAELASELGQRYYAIRFGGAALTPQTQREAEALLARLGDALRQPRGEAGGRR